MQGICRPSIDNDERVALLNKLKSSPGGLDGDLALALKQGVAFHHAGLTTEEREYLEDAFHNGVVSAVFVCAYIALVFMFVYANFTFCVRVDTGGAFCFAD